MPVFINEVVFRGDVQRRREPGEDDRGATSYADRDALIAEVTEAVIDYLERELDRTGER